MDMKQKFYVSICQENEWFVAQALGIDVASQGTTVEESLDNLREALGLHFEPPAAVAYPQNRELEVEVSASWAAHLSGSGPQTSTRRVSGG